MGCPPIYDISLALFRMSVTERQLRSRKREAGVDLNQLLYHHQIALMAVSQARRDGHLLPSFDLPRYYAKRISEYRERRGLADGFAAMIEQTGDRPRADPPIGRSEERRVGKECVR